MKWPWTKTKERFEKIELEIVNSLNELSDYKQHVFSTYNPILEKIQSLEEVNRQQELDISSIKKVQDIFEKKIRVLESQTEEIQQGILDHGKNHVTQQQVKDLEDIKERLGKSELAHAAVFKKMSENFSESMARMIEVNGKAISHVATLADQRNREIMAAMGIKSEEPKEFYILLNGQVEKVESKEMTYDQILDLFLYPFPERKEDELFSIAYEDGGDEGNPFGTISANDVLVVKPGTSINVSRLGESGQ